MPETKLQDILFTIMMVFVMVYAMIVYNIALNTGGMSYMALTSAFHELIIMGPVAFILDFFLVGHLAKKITFKHIDPASFPSIFVILGISFVSVIWMCPLMSLATTLLFKNAGGSILPVWLQTIAFNFPMALCWQLCFAGPLVRFIFSHLSKRQKA